MRKKAALELSIGTIVVIVIAITMLIFGIVFVRKIMCSGIIITDQISAGVENEIKNLFGANDYGVKCMGEEGQEIKLGDGGSRQVICIINTDTQAEYKLTVKNIESLRGASTTTVNKWVLKQDWKGTVPPGSKTVPALILEVPQKVSATTLEIEIEEENLDSGTKETHTSIIDVVHVGGFKTAIC